MHKKNFSENQLGKYISPRIETIMIELENGLAGQSTDVKPGDSGGNVNVEDWGNGGDIEGSIPW